MPDDTGIYSLIISSYFLIGLISLLLLITILIIVNRKSKKEKDKEMIKGILKSVLANKQTIEKRQEKEKKERGVIIELIACELLFVFGAAFSVIGYLASKYVVLIAGLASMIVSLPFLELILKTKAEKPEEKIVEKVERLLKKENFLKKKEGQLKKEIDLIYDQALKLMNIETTMISTRHVEGDVKKVLKITDELLEKLPEEEIERFVKSKDFKLYKNVMKKMKEEK